MKSLATLFLALTLLCGNAQAEESQVRVDNGTVVFSTGVNTLICPATDALMVAIRYMPSIKGKTITIRSYHTSAQILIGTPISPVVEFVDTGCVVITH